jgi:hypothetical protein
VRDGVEGKTHMRPDEEPDTTSIVLSARRGRVAYTAKQGAAINAPVHLYVDDRVVTRTAHGFRFLTFSGDSMRLAGAVFQLDSGQPNMSAPPAGRGNPSGPGRRFVFVDDWNSPDYSGAVEGGPGYRIRGQALFFSPDSKRFAFIADKGIGRLVAVVDAKESAEYIEIGNFQFSNDSRRYAFEARNNLGEVAVVDGNQGPQMRLLTRESLTFSPDGSRFAYQGTQNGIMDAIDVVDGVSQQGSGAFGWRLPVPPRPIHFAFSPNGQRIMRLERLSNPPGFVINGVGIPQGATAKMPTFSPDGRHFAFFVEQNRKWTLVVDAKSIPIDGDVYEVPGALQFQGDATLVLLATKDDWLRRLQITIQ